MTRDMDWEGPLAGLRILEAGSDLSAAFGSRVLADLGAEVIKVEPRHGDPARHIGPFHPDAPRGENSAFFGYLNSGKRSIQLDLGSAEGISLLHEVTRRCDAVIADMTVHRLLPEEASLPPRIVASPYGLGQDRPSTPFIAQHASGFAFHQASPVTNPATTPPVACADWEGTLAPGLVVAIATLWAIAAAGCDGANPVVDVATAEVLTYLLVEPFADAQIGKTTSNRQRDSEQGLTIAGGLVWLLPCSDGMILVSPRENHQWERWLDVIGRPAWSTDATLCAGREERTKNAAALQRLMAEWSISQKTKDLARRAQDSRVACFPISAPLDLLNNEQFAHRNFFDDMNLNSSVAIRTPGLPFTFETASGRSLPRGRKLHAPRTGEDTAAILRELRTHASAEGGLNAVDIPQDI